MAELANCARCGDIFAKINGDICRACFNEEEAAFETVYCFLMKKENREATIPEIADATNIEKTQIIKFLKENRLRTSRFPKLSYPCETCGIQIISGRICTRCSKQILEGFKQYGEDRKREKRAQHPVYYVIDKQKK